MFEFSFKYLCGIVDAGGRRKEIAQGFLKPSSRHELLRAPPSFI
jgi:hypothetical protein